MNDPSPSGPVPSVVPRLLYLVGVPGFTASLFWLFPDAAEFACFFVPVAAAYLVFLPVYALRPSRSGPFRFLLPLLFMAVVFGTALLADGIYQVKTSATRTAIANDLKQIALALRAYHDRHGAFPPAAVRGPDGTPLYSWRVALLPFLEEENLYRQFHLDEPWDGPHNKTLLAARPRTYSPKPLLVDPDPAATYYQVFVGPGVAFEGDRGLSLKADFPRDPAETIVVVEARDAVPWTRPADLPFTPDGPLPALGAPRHERFGRFLYGRALPSAFNAAMGDADVHAFPADPPAGTLRAWITRTGKEHPPGD